MAINSNEQDSLLQVRPGVQIQGCIPVLKDAGNHVADAFAHTARRKPLCSTPTARSGIAARSMTSTGISSGGKRPARRT